MTVLQVSREEAKRERGTVDGNLLLYHRSTVAPAVDWRRLRGGVAGDVRENGEGANGREERLP
jgi:hypothetical protein